MKAGSAWAVGVAIAALAAGGGYWVGRHHPAPEASASAGTDGGKPARKLLYYRNPMGLPDTSPTPKKDPMGMDYIPVYEGEADTTPGAPNAVRITRDKVQQLGVRVEPAQWRRVDRTVRAAGRIEADERLLYAIAPKFEGYVDHLHVNVTGQPVSAGQALFEVYSPELVSAQREYAIAVQGVAALNKGGGQALAGMKQLAEASLQRLRNWDISNEQIQTLARTGEAKRTLTFRSPVSGIVTEKKAMQGMRFMPGDTLFQVTDLSRVWAIADVFEQDVALVQPGAQARLTMSAYPGKVFEGTVTYIYPTLKAETRTVAVRVELPNPGLLLKPAMFAEMMLAAAPRSEVVTVPTSAVIDSGTRQIVLIQLGEGRFAPREVKLGARGAQYVEILDGVKEGEPVVVAANFLIDAESNLKAALSGFNGPAQSDPVAAPVGHRAEGKVDEVDLQNGVATLSHGPVASLRWPAMTMEFKAANAALLQSLKPGARITFVFVERKPGEWVITEVQPASPHAGH